MVSKATEYYNQTAEQYNKYRQNEREHLRAIERAALLLRGRDIRSILDVGCGTGNTLRQSAKCFPNVEKLCGVDPSQSMLDIAARTEANVDLVLSTGESLPFEANSFDLVIACGVMHHADRPRRVIAEMRRVSRQAILVSDHNNFAFGSVAVRRIRLVLYAMRLLRAATFVKQGFRKQGYSDEDGWWYPYSLFEHYALIADKATQMSVLPTRPINSNVPGNMILIQSHVAFLGEYC